MFRRFFNRRAIREVMSQYRSWQRMYAVGRTKREKLYAAGHMTGLLTALDVLGHDIQGELIPPEEQEDLWEDQPA